MTTDTPESLQEIERLLNEYMVQLLKRTHGTKDHRERLLSAISRVVQERDALEKALRGLKRERHYECEDSWYSCPKSEEGCADDRETGCTCGTDHWNERIDAALAEVGQMEGTP